MIARGRTSGAIRRIRLTAPSRALTGWSSRSVIESGSAKNERYMTNGPSIASSGPGMTRATLPPITLRAMAEPTIRAARPGEAATLTELAMRSKAHWGYDPAFMTRLRPILTIGEQELLASPARGLDDVGGAAV